MSIKIQFSAQLPVFLKRKKNHYLASCPLLDVHSQGENEKQAKQNLADALVLFFETCFEMGTLDDVLKDCGFHSLDMQSPSKKKAIKYHDFVDVSLPLVPKTAYNRCRA